MIRIRISYVANYYWYCILLGDSRILIGHDDMLIPFSDHL